MTTYQGPMVVARGLYLGLSPAGDKAVWLASPDQLYEFPRELAPYLEYASGALPRRDLVALMATLERGDDAIRVLNDAQVILELADDVDEALDALRGKVIHPLNVRMRTVDGIIGDGDLLHDITVRRLAGEDEIVIPHPISTVMDDLEHDLTGAIKAVAQTATVDVGDVLGQVLAQLGYLIVERIGFLADAGREQA